MKVNDKIKKAFGQIQAEDELKLKTKVYVLEKTKTYKQKKNISKQSLLIALGCILFFVISGHWLYFTPVVNISIDINPSIELSVNRFNHVISFDSYNEDGKDIIDHLDVTFMHYDDAIEEITKNEKINTLLSNDEYMMISVVGKENSQSKKILSDVQSCMQGKNNTHCQYVNEKEVKQAHEVGLTYGKYKAYLELKELDSNISVEEIQNMTMREFKNQIDILSNKDENSKCQMHRHGKKDNED